MPLYNQFSRYRPDDWRKYRHVYFRLIERVDQSIGRILSSLDRHGVVDETVVILTSDHGDMQGAHGLGHKIALYEESIRVPLCVRYPGISQRRRVVDHLVCNGLDLLPTICEIAGIDTENELEGDRTGVIRGGTYEGSARYPITNTALQGASLMGYITGSGESETRLRSELVVETNHRDGRLINGRAVIGERYKYAAYNHGRNREQLFDLREDPGEMRNLAVERRYRPVLDEKRQSLKDWMDETDDRFEGHYAFRNSDGRLPSLPGEDWE
jgi:glucosamine-6-phosphate deaminase